MMTGAEPGPASSGLSDAQAIKVKKKRVENLDVRCNDHLPKFANKRIKTRWYYPDQFLTILIFGSKPFLTFCLLRPHQCSKVNLAGLCCQAGYVIPPVTLQG